MAIEITIPRLGWSMEEGVLVQWLKRDGDFVARGEMIFLLESEKATQEIESLDEGLLHIPAGAAKPGDTVAVGQVIGVLLAKGESPPTTAAPSALSDVQAATSVPAPTAVVEAVNGPAARRAARKKKLEDAAPAALAPTAVTQAAVAQSPVGDCAITPRARRVARELGVTIEGLAGTGRMGRLREQDVRAAAQSRPVSPAASPIIANGRKAGVGMSNVRRTIARRMAASHQTTAPVTLTSRADATKLVELRSQFVAAHASGAITLVPTFTDLIIKLVAVALADHPRMNARWEDDNIIDQADVHIGVAVDTEAGLLVPVVHNVSQLRVAQIAALTKELVAKARSGGLLANDYQGGTFTITNLGMYGIDAFTPIINPPETGILGIGAIRREATFVGETIVPRDLLTLSLTFDHRVLDGAPAARFLQSLVRAIEHPAASLV